MRGKRVERRCICCGAVFYPREADVKRGWGKFCSKSCKAHDQTRRTGIDGSDYRAANRSVEQMSNGSYAKSKFKHGVTLWDAAGVSKEVYLYYQKEYGGIPLFDRHGNYDGFIPEPFDNTKKDH